MGGRLHRTAAAGNATVLLLLVFVLVHATTLFERETCLVQPNVQEKPASGPAVRAVLIIVDGLRSDTSIDPGSMPFLRELGRRGGHGTARVESLIPSSIAAIETLSTGRVPPPVSALSDFGAGPAKRGGIFEAVVNADRSTFVAGPSLWTDRFGRWISQSETDPTFGMRDERLLVAALDALASRDDSLVVIHFGKVDAAAHRSGAVSPEYQTAAEWCDRAIRQIANAAGPCAAIVVTSDHGHRNDGGHAGHEPEVILTPLVVAGPGLPQGELGEMPQGAVPNLLLHALGIDGERVLQPAAAANRPLWQLAVAVIVTIPCALAIWSSLSGSRDGRRRAFLLNAAVWAMLVVTIAGWTSVAFLLGVAAFVASAAASGSRVSPCIFSLAGAGVIVGLLRITDGFSSLIREPELGRCVWLSVLASGLVLLVLQRRPRPAAVIARLNESLRGDWGHVFVAILPISFLLGSAALAVIFVMGFLLGQTTGRLLSGNVNWRTAAAGASLAGALALLGRLAGETVSLSTIDVRTAFAFVDRPFGLPLAILIVIATQLMPAAGLLLGIAPATVRLDGKSAGAFASGLAAGLGGQTVVASLMLAFAPDAPVPSLAFGLLIRVFAETMYLFLGLAVVFALDALATRRERPRPCVGAGALSGRSAMLCRVRAARDERS